MHGFPVLLALTILFYVIRAVFRGIRSLVQWVRRSSAPRPVEQGTPAPSQKAQPPRPRPEARGRRPEAGGPAVTGVATDPQFRAQVAEIEETEAAFRRPQPSRTEADPTPPPPSLLRGPDDLLRAVILQEVFARPLSQRRRMPQAGHTSPPPPQ